MFRAFFRGLAEKFRPASKDAAIEPDASTGSGVSGFMAFSHTGQVVAARTALLAAGLAPQIKAPPPSLREGCDMVLEFPAELEAVYLAVLEAKGLRPLKIMAVDGPLTTPESLFRRLDYPNHIMVASANMKITMCRESGLIVNVSGGGCPDVPFLAARLMGRTVLEAASPSELSRSLCSFSLAQARDEAEKIFRAGLPPLNAPQPLDFQGLDEALPWPAKKPEARSGPWLVVGTLADPAEPLAEGEFDWVDGRLIWNGRAIEPERGSAALMSAYALAAKALKLPPGRALLAGDDGGGAGSRAVYEWLLPRIEANPWSGLTFHYLYPDATRHDRIFLALDELSPRPLLAADAGFMYVAKLCGVAAEYDLFTPDAGEMAYLADPEAPHPFYTRGALMQREVEEAAFAETHRQGNAARTMVVKGRADAVVWRGRTVHRVAGPSVPAMEAIGGTGDTLTGLASAFLAAGFSPPRAGALAAHCNRRAGFSADPGPGDSLGGLLGSLEKLMAELCGEWGL